MDPASRDTHHIRVGLVGYGLGGATFHAPLLAATRGMELAAIVTRDAGRRAEAAARFPRARLVESLAGLWPLGLDLVVVSSPSALHVPMAREALAHGCHVVVDKPFASTAREARELAGAAERAGRLAIPFQNRRWDGDFLTLRRLARAGTLGRLHRLESRFERWREVVKPRWMMPDARALAEGIVFDIGSHLVDQALVLMGPALSVHAELSRVRPGVTVEDTAFISILHQDGARSHLHMSAAAPVSGARFTLSGERGAWVKHGLDGQEAALKAGGVPGTPGWGVEPQAQWGTLAVGTHESRIPTEPGAYADFYAGVQAALATGAAPPVTAIEAADALVVMEAAFRSHDTGTAVRVAGREAMRT